MARGSINVGGGIGGVYTATITTTWVGASVPYTQTITVNNITANDMPIITAVYSSNNETAKLEKIAWDYISKIETGDNSITCTCFETKPKTAINIQIKVVY
jgi:hypothetical protein